MDRIIVLAVFLGLIISCSKSGETVTQDPTPTSNLTVTEVQLSGGDFDMGDHFGFVDPNHPSDEMPIHKVKVNAFRMATTVTTNQQFLAYLNSALTKGLIEIRNNVVYGAGS